MGADQENVSVDEMMNRLKRSKQKQSAKETVGEMVIREDGSKMMKVKRRKRRSEQAIYEKRKKEKRVKVGIFIACFSLFLTAIALFAFVFIHFNSVGFTAKARQQVKTAISVEPEFVNLSITPLSASAQAMTMNWPDDSFIAKMQFKNLTAKPDIIRMLGGKLVSEEVFVQTASTSLKFPVGDGEQAVEAVETDKVMQIPRLRVRNGSIAATGAFAKKFALNGSEMSFRSSEGLLRMWLKDGSFTFGDWGVWQVNRGSFALTGNTLRAEYFEASLKEQDALMRVQDHDISIGNDSVEIEIDVERLPLKMLFGESFAELVGGVIDAQNVAIRIPQDDPENWHIKGTFSSGKVYLARLPMFSTIKTILESTEKASELSKPVFSEKVDGGFEIKDGDLTVRFNALNRPGQLAVEGELRNTLGGQLTGELKIGIPPSYVDEIPGSKIRAAFSVESNGYRWVSSRVRGTVKSPDDDFYDTLINQKVNSRKDREDLLEESKTLEDVFNELTN